MNDLENIPIGLIVSWASAFVSGLDGTSDGFSTLHIVVHLSRFFPCPRAEVPD